MEVKSWLTRLLPYAAMVSVECLDVGLTTLSKAAMSRGMSHFIFILYSNAIATLILFPVSSFIARYNRPPITLSLLCKFFLLGLVGISLMQNCVFTGVSYSSPTLASAMANLVPAFTFLLTVIFRIEKVDFWSSRSQIQLLGTFVSISGAFIIIIYKGPAIGPQMSAFLNSADSFPSQASLQGMAALASNWIIGGLFLFTASLSAATWITAQAAVLKGYPSEITMVSFYCFFGTIQCGVVALVAERDPNAWKLKSSIEIISVLYSALFGNIISFCVFSWCIHKKGPIFVATFKPLSIGIAAMTGIIFLGDALHVGSVIGAIVIVAGFYGVIWAQSQEEKEVEVQGPDILHPPSQKTPLLESNARP